MNKKLKILKELFWNYKLESVIEKLDSPFAITKALEIRNEKQVKILIQEIGEPKIVAFPKKYEKRCFQKSLIISGANAMKFQIKNLLIKNLLTEHQKVISKIKNILNQGNFYSAGGTALYYILNQYILNHRNSIDLVFFTPENINFIKFSDNFKTNESKLKPLNLSLL